VANEKKIGESRRHLIARKDKERVMANPTAYRENENRNTMRQAAKTNIATTQKQLGETGRKQVAAKARPSKRSTKASGR
jgi:hypothetical protein